MYNPEEEIERSESIEELVRVLEALFNHGYAVDMEGRLYVTFKEIDRAEGLHFIIRHNEHPPPHFHVIGDDVNATFEILTGNFLRGTIDNGRKRLVRWWHKRSREKLIKEWNRTRPSDCSIGPI